MKSDWIQEKALMHLANLKILFQLRYEIRKEAWWKSIKSKSDLEWI